MTRYDTGNNQGRNDDEGPGLLVSVGLWIGAAISIGVWTVLVILWRAGW